MCCHCLKKLRSSLSAAARQSDTAMLQWQPMRCQGVDTFVELVSEEIINSSVMLTVFSETYKSLEDFYA